MGDTIMPARTKCVRCQREFPVKAVMSLEDESDIPLLVVLTEVSSIEEAIALATCQVCLKRQGPTDRGLYDLLLSLGAVDSVSAHSARGSSIPKVDLAALARLQTRAVKPVVPLLAGVRIQMPWREEHLPPRGTFRPPPRRPERIDDEPRIPKALQPQEKRESEPKVEPLKGGLDARSLAALQAARPAARARDQAKQLRLFSKLGACMKVLKSQLREIRTQAAERDVSTWLTAFDAKLAEAVICDPKHRDRGALLALLATSQGELETLGQQFWLTHSAAVPTQGGGGSGPGRAKGDAPKSARVRAPMEEGQDNPFEGGVRPRRFHGKGESPPAPMRLVTVVRTAVPKTNKPLQDLNPASVPKVVYPQGQCYGRDYEVRGSQRVAPVIGETHDWAWTQIRLATWACNHERAALVCNGKSLDLTLVMGAFLEEALDALSLKAQDTLVVPRAELAPEDRPEV
ncbi:hypothetical protein HY631_04185 [Candidatus Uhrbacteria bacterium]|nr:hypothetical protein [Candidatus Uhrbacteria bacterium]